MPSPSDQPIDIAIYRQSNGGAYVAPPALPVSKSKKTIIVFGNFNKEKVKITLDGLPTLTVNGNSKKGLDISKLPRGVYEYDVIVGDDFAVGNSSPIIIIDE